MIKPKLDNVIKYSNEDGTIGGGHLGGNEKPLAKYMPKEPPKKRKKNEVHSKLEWRKR